MAVKDVVGIFSALVVVAGIFVMVSHGSGTAAVLQASGDAFSNSVKAATGQG